MIMLYVVAVALLSPHYAWSPATALCHTQLWRSKNRLKLPSSGCSKWQCPAWAAPSPPSPPDDDEDSTARRCAAEVLALLGGGGDDTNNITQSRAQELLSSIRFLVPPTGFRSWGVSRAAPPESSRTGYGSRGVSRAAPPEQIWKLIREPPASVAELARKSVEWAGEPDAILAELNPALHKVPDVENSNASKCSLTKHDCGKRFANEEINAYMAFLFQAIVALAPSAGLNVSLNRYDLFHGHMFTAYGTGRLGILFHCREYPEYDPYSFDVNLGYCQAGSYIPYDSGMNLRNIVWLAPMPSCTGRKCSATKWIAPGSLFILDAKPGGVFFEELVSEWVDVVRTIYESDFGRIVTDVNYFNIEGCQIFLT